MGNRIIRLSDDLVGKIAAGEVIERPASCVKELIENSIDAGASRVFCEVKGNGVAEMRVSDDGFGITIDELELAAESHTTSKLSGEKDLFKITNFGFRGEALPSICRVAEVEISSRSRDEGVGGYIRVRDERIIEKREAPRGEGTAVRVRDLFYNVPVRRKFLKSAGTELRYISGVIQRLALSDPGISFVFVHDGHEILNLPREDLGQRIRRLFGSDFFDSVVWVGYESAGIRVLGYLSKPYNLFVNPNQFIYINKRPCRDRIVKKAIERAYGAPLKERVPSYILFVDVPPEFVDVNVHPRKEEVRFRNDGIIYNTVLKGVREGLGIKEAVILGEEEREWEFVLEGARYWQFYDSYIFAETRDGILILDQHAAHERVMYERIKREGVVSQKLVFPVLIELRGDEEKLLREFRSSFEGLGFGVEEFGVGTWRVVSIPSILKDFSSDLFKVMLVELSEYGEVEDKMKEVVKLVACKSAIKAGDKLGMEEIRALTRALFTTENPYFCPHGRPTIIKFTKEELEHKFGK